MMKKFTMLALIMFGLFILSVTSVLADSINIKKDAPEAYVVKKGDTLWDISSLFLDQAWLWPELWRNNVQIENPHLIYPGDELRLRYIDGQPVMELVRDKPLIAMTPDSATKVKPSPIGILPWNTLAPYFNNESIVDVDTYDDLPRLLGNNAGTTLFVKRDFVLSHKPDNPDINYTIIRKGKTLKNTSGDIVGYQVRNIGEVEILDSGSDSQQIVRFIQSKREANPGDKLMPVQTFDKSDLVLKAATEDQIGRIITNIEDRTLIGKRDVVVISLGSSDIDPGTVMGIYLQGPDIYDSEEPQYKRKQSVVSRLFSVSKTIEQPAFKVGELIVFKTFDDLSYAWVTKAEQHLQGGEILGKP